MTTPSPVTIDAELTIHSDAADVVSALKAAAAAERLSVVVEQAPGNSLHLSLSSTDLDSAVKAVELLGPTLARFDGLASVDSITVNGKVTAGLAAGLRSVTTKLSLVE
jgi:hypothetical protein